LFTKYVLDAKGDVEKDNMPKGGLRNIDWSCIIFDEAHCLKSATAQVCVAAKTMNTSVKIAMTGTPMQNNLDELWRFCDNVGIDSFGDFKTFKSYYKVPISFGRQRTAGDVAYGKASQRQGELNLALNRVMLRRLKEDTIANLLSAKKEFVVFCPLSELQIRCYKRVLNSPDYQLLLRKDEPCDCGRADQTRGKCCHGGGGGGLFEEEEENRKDKRGGIQKLTVVKSDVVEDGGGKVKKRKKKKKKQRARGGVLWDGMHEDGYECEKCPSCLTLLCLPKLMQLCNHLELIKPSPNSTNPTRDRLFAEMAYGEDIDSVGGIDPEERFHKLKDTANCGKMKTLMVLLNKWIRKERKKILLFSNFTRTLDILGKVLDGLGYNHCRLDGSTPKEHRLKMCDDFNEDSTLSIFLISTKAGGMGLNLTGAQIVVIFDPSWNP
jgi:SNF2 family DNA or RNA helicase